MRVMAARFAALGAALWLVSLAGPVAAAQCGGDFGTWLAGFEKRALAAGISQGTLNAALSGVTPSAAILKLDRRQGYFKQSFETYRAKRVTAAHLRIGKERLRRSAGFFAKLEKRFGVPAPIIVAIWGLETGFGGGTGNTPAIRSLVTLAHDCRRSDFFTDELMAALHIVQRGDLSPAAMRGGWAGEVGQTQFMPSSYVKFAIDYDGDGRRDLIHSWPDALASTANYLKGYGWQAGRAVGGRQRQLPGVAQMEQGRRLLPHDRLVRPADSLEVPLCRRRAGKAVRRAVEAVRLWRGGNAGQKPRTPVAERICRKRPPIRVALADLRRANDRHYAGKRPFGSFSIEDRVLRQIMQTRFDCVFETNTGILRVICPRSTPVSAEGTLRQKDGQVPFRGARRDHMKLKTLLLSSAAAFAVVGGAQAADLSVAEPVDYVKVCDAFGAGYWYIPGTDTCLKIGGLVRLDTNFHSTAATDWGTSGGTPRRGTSTPRPTSTSPPSR